MDVFIKDLSNLGRDLDKTIIVDNITENFLLQPENGISIKSWFDDPDDTALLDLAAWPSRRARSSSYKRSPQERRTLRRG
jgi:TFIIF-interacting CTD phosphatase-like protein